jgi:phage protein U
MQKKYLFLSLLFSYGFLIADSYNYAPNQLYKPKLPENFTIDVNEQGLALIGSLYKDFSGHKSFLKKLKKLINEGLEKDYIKESLELTELYVAFSMLSNKAVLFDKYSSIKSLMSGVWPACYFLNRICCSVVALKGKYFYRVSDCDEPSELLRAIMLELQDSQENFKIQNNEFYFKLASILYDFFANARDSIVEYEKIIPALDAFTVIPAISVAQGIKINCTNTLSQENIEG